MPIQIVRNDITKMQVDAIVNAANPMLKKGGGVCGAIHQAAGPELEEECRALGGCITGKAKITRAYRLPCRYVIHAVGPVWNGGWRGEEKLLASCYRESLQLAVQYECQSIAFPLISSGVYGYPKPQALKIAADAIRDFLMGLDGDLTVYLVVFSDEVFHISEKLYAGVVSYIDDRYARQQLEREAGRRRQQEYAAVPEKIRASHSFSDPAAFSIKDLQSALKDMDESFSQMVLRKIDEKGMTDPECYKKANLSRKLFSKIRNDIHYQPKKQTALALAIALELPMAETEMLLKKAGLALNPSSKFDMIIEYFISSGIYDLFLINHVLFELDQMLLGV